MGNVKPAYIKNVGRQLLAAYPGEFTLDMEANKRKVSEKTSIRSKNIRNRVAGYVTNLKHLEVRRASAPPETPV
ncbi:MAG: 30S ribosomal protein S17e [Euryarchaeota archaeon]|nr:30S ribosomal protein S17e [Euryarchaeota archaeon]